MTERAVVEMRESEHRVMIEYFDALDPEVSTALHSILRDAGLARTLVAGLNAFLSDMSTWRLTVSGDVVSTVNAIEQRVEGNGYSMNRGIGQVGARTISAADGTYDIVINASAFMPPFEVSSPEELVGYMHRIGLHLAIHEAGHAILHQRGEDLDEYQDLAAGSKTERAWRKHLAAHVDDFRIEKMTNRTAPSPVSNVDGIGDTLAHMRIELGESSRLRITDGDAAMFRSSTAVNDLLRVMTYLSAELGVDKIVSGLRPAPLPPGWDEYLEEVWDAWALNLDRLEPADKPMALAEIASVLTDLCKIVVLWTRNIVGYHFEIHDDDSWSANWARATY